MKKNKIEVEYEVYNDENELKENDRQLILAAREITTDAYAPYSNFLVGAAARLSDGNIVKGTNQENASYPVGICAERSLLSTAATLFPGRAIDTIAISYFNKKQESKSNKPISPCGMCRQALQEYEGRGRQPMRIILSGQTGEIYILNGIKSLLPFAFTPEELAG